jgi:hypothetical protein
MGVKCPCNGIQKRSTQQSDLKAPGECHQHDRDRPQNRGRTVHGKSPVHQLAYTQSGFGEWHAHKKSQRKEQHCADKDARQERHSGQGIGHMTKALANDMDAIKVFCEKTT